MTTRFYLLPIEQVGNYRGPKYLKWRFNPDGLTGQWSLNDFGEADIALIASEDELIKPDVIELGTTWSQKQRGAIASYLGNSGIESAWINGAADWREALHRIAGMTQAMQANDDKPDRWLGRPVYMGFTGLNPLDWTAFEQEQQAKLNQVIEYLQVKDNFDKQSPGWRDILKLAIDNPLSIPFMALPATDTFTAANGTALTTYSANWTLNSGDFAINTNAVYPNSSGNECGAHWNADSFNADQYASGTISNAGGNPVGPAVRCHTSSASYYGLYGDLSALYMFKYISPTWTQKGSSGGACATNDTLKLEISGTTLTPYKNGGTISPPGAQTDSSIASGYAGITGYSSGTSQRFDTWEGGNLGGAAVEGAADLTGTGALSATGIQTVVTATANLSGAGDLTATALQVVSAQATLSGAGDLTATGTRTVPGAANLSGAGDLSATAQTSIAGQATLSGVGDLTAQALVNEIATATLTGAGDLSAQASTTAIAQATLTGAGDLTAQGAVAIQAAATLSGAGDLSATGTIAFQGAATLSGSGNLSAQATLTIAGQATLSGAGDLTAQGLVNEIAAATLSGLGGLTATGSIVGAVVANLSGSGDLTAQALVTKLATATLSGTGDLTAVGSVAGTVSGTANLSGSGDLSASADVTALATAILSGVGDLTAQGVPLIPAVANLSGVGTLTAQGLTVYQVVANLSGQGTLQGQALLLVLAVAALSGDGDLTAIGFVPGGLTRATFRGMFRGMYRRQNVDQ